MVLLARLIAGYTVCIMLFQMVWHFTLSNASLNG